MASEPQSSVLIDDESSIYDPSDLDSEQFESQSTTCKRTRDDEFPDSVRRKRRKHTALAIWNHARPAKLEESVRDEHGHKLWYCARCGHKCAALGRAREHMRKGHGIKVQEALTPSEQAKSNTLKRIFDQQRGKQEGRDIEQENHLKAAINKDAFDEALAQLITLHNLPFSCVEWPALHALVHSVNYMADKLCLASRGSIPQLIGKAYVEQKAIIRQRLHDSLSLIHFSIDMWTAPTHTGYQAIVAHFVDADARQISKALLALVEHKGSHGGESQAKAFLEVIDDYDLRTKIGYFTADNHPSNDKMLRHIAEQIPGFNAVKRRIRCNGHIINLAVQAFLFTKDKEAVEAAIEYTKKLARDERSGKRDKTQTAVEWRQMGVLGHLHNLIVHIRSSTQRYNAFKALAGRSIPLDNDTRWNSWWLELHVALKKRKELIIYMDDYHAEIKDDFLSREKWNELQEIHDFLQPFYDITIHTQGDQSTIDQILTDMDFLVTHFKEAEKMYTREQNHAMLRRVMTSWYHFDKYYSYTDDSPAYAAAILLHPSLRKAYLEKQWAHQAEYIQPTKDSVKELWQMNYKKEKPLVANTTKSKFKSWREEIYEERY
jgi:hypothetical protein